jgi:hypothetical protein
MLMEVRAFASGGSFLGTAASTAAGVIGGGLLLNNIRSMFVERAGLAHDAGSDTSSRLPQGRSVARRIMAWAPSGAGDEF